MPSLTTKNIVELWVKENYLHIPQNPWVSDPKVDHNLKIPANQWLDHHLETFVRPVLGSIPDVSAKDWWIREWTALNLKYLYAAWQRAKWLADGSPILLPGRDVWPLQILAQLEGFPVTFAPIISTPVAKDYFKHKKRDYVHHFCVDTGYSGTVPTKLGCRRWALINYRPYNLSEKMRLEKVHLYQVFPKPKNPHISQIASLMERTPSYWTRASVSASGKYVQELAYAVTFKNAAQVTQAIVAGLLPLMAKMRPLKPHHPIRKTQTVVQSVGRYL